MACIGYFTAVFTCMECPPPTDRLTVRLPPSPALGFPLRCASYDGVTCFRIKVSNVTLNLGGHTIRGFNGSPAYGVFADGPATLGIKVLNGNASDFTVGGYLGGTFGAVIENLEVNVNKNVGLIAGTGAVIQHVKAAQNRNQGVTAGPGSYVNDLAIQSSGSDGLRVGLGSMVFNTWSEFNAGYGIVLDRTLLGPFTSIWANTTGANGKGGISADCAGGAQHGGSGPYFGLGMTGNLNDPLFPNSGPHIVANVPVVYTYTANGTQYLSEFCQASSPTPSSTRARTIDAADHPGGSLWSRCASSCRNRP